MNKDLRFPGNGMNGEFFKRYGMLMILVLSIPLPLFVGTYTVFLFSKVLLLAFSSMAYIFLAGYGGMISFAHISFYGLSAYTLAISTVIYQKNYWTSALFGIMLSILVSLIYAFVSVRATGRYFFQISIAFVQLIYLTAIQWADLTRGTKGVSGIPMASIAGIEFNSRERVFFLMLFLTILGYFLFRRLTESPFGIALKGSRDNAAKLASMGFHVELQRYVAIVIASLFMAVSGVMGMILYRVVAPENVGSASAIILVFIALIGCAKKLEGAFLGAFIYVFLQNFISSITNRYNMVLGVFFIIVVMFFPNGILGVNRHRILKKVEKKVKKETIKNE